MPSWASWSCRRPRGRQTRTGRWHSITTKKWSCLQAASEPLQAALFGRERELLDIPETIVFYDLSNVHFHGGRSGELKRYGRSKRKRNDCPLATLALALDEAGFPRSAEADRGNGCRDRERDQPRMAKRRRLRLDHDRTGEKAEAAERRAEHPPGDDGRGRGEGLAPGSRRRGEEALRRQRRQEEDGGFHSGGAAEALRGGAGEAARRAGGQGGADEAARQGDGERRPPQGEVFQGGSQHSIDVEGDGKGANAVAVRFRRNRLHAEADEFSGSYLLRTAKSNWDDEAVLRSYWRLSEIEATFRSLKSELGLRPVFHQLDKRIRSHLLIAALAFHPAHLIRTRLKSRGINPGWASVRERMRSWIRITTTLRKTDGALVVIRQDSNPGAEQASISRVAGVEPGLHRKRSEPGV